MRSPITYAGRGGIADRVDSLVVRDATGVVALTVVDDPVNRGGFPYYRHWRADRAVIPPVVITYRMKSFTGTPTPGPQFDFYSHGGGISSGGMALFVLPENLGATMWRLRWDLSDLAPGSIAASTFGQGDVDVQGPADRLTNAYYMAGTLGHYAPPGVDAATGFHAYWLGQPTFDPAREMSWTWQAYEYMRKFYRDTTASSYRVFVRALPVPSRVGGTALFNSFMVGIPAGVPDSTATGPRGTLFHEMGHMFVGNLSGGGEAGTTWFNEGLNVYYTRLLMLRSGLAPLSEYVDSFNESMRNYLTNGFRNVPADSLARLGFSTGVGAGSAQNIAYTRGSLYFADVDAKIRAASQGRRSLDDVILALFDRRRNGEQLNQNILVEALVREIGPSAREKFEAVIVRGETIVPESGAIGPCFERQAITWSMLDTMIEGYQWVRVPTVPRIEVGGPPRVPGGLFLPEDKCRTW